MLHFTPHITLCAFDLCMWTVKWQLTLSQLHPCIFLNLWEWKRMRRELVIISREPDAHDNSTITISCCDFKHYLQDLLRSFSLSHSHSLSWLLNKHSELLAVSLLFLFCCCCFFSWCSHIYIHIELGGWSHLNTYVYIFMFEKRPRIETQNDQFILKCLCVCE